MGIRIGVEAASLSDLDFMLLDQHFLPCHVFPNSNPGVLGSSPGQQFQTPPASMLPICQLCNSEGHTALFCGNSSSQHTKCHICPIYRTCAASLAKASTLIMYLMYLMSKNVFMWKMWGDKEFLSFISGKIEWESPPGILVTRNPNWSQRSGTGTGCIKERY